MDDPSSASTAAQPLANGSDEPPTLRADTPAGTGGASTPMSALPTATGGGPVAQSEGGSRPVAGDDGTSAALSSAATPADLADGKSDVGGGRSPEHGALSSLPQVVSQPSMNPTPQPSPDPNTSTPSGAAHVPRGAPPASDAGRHSSGTGAAAPSPLVPVAAAAGSVRGPSGGGGGGGGSSVGYPLDSAPMGSPAALPKAQSFVSASSLPPRPYRDDPSHSGRASLPTTGGLPGGLVPGSSTGFGRSSSGAPTRLNPTVRRELVEAKLQAFYRDHCPAKAHHVREIYETFESNIEDLFSQLLAKYPKAPRDSFNELTALLNPAPPPPPQHPSSFPGGVGGLGGLRSSSQGGDSTAVSGAGGMPSGSVSRVSVGGGGGVSPSAAAGRDMYRQGSPSAGSLPPRSAAHSFRVGNSPMHADPNLGGPPSEKAPRVGFDLTGTKGGNAGTVAALLSNGQKLLDASPIVPQSAASTAQQRQTEGYRRQLSELDTLVEDNVKLAQQVADAELAVLHARFRVLLEHCRSPKGGLSQECGPGDRMVIAMDGRRFSVPISDALWRYLLEGPCRAPLPARTSGAVLCRVDVLGLRRAANFAGAEVDANIMAAAMREWARQVPHVVTEELADAPHRRAPFGLAPGQRPETTYGQSGASGSGGVGGFRFHTSGSLWWSWPSPVQKHAGVQAQSLFADASDGNDTAIARTLLSNLDGNPAGAATVEALGLSLNSPLASQPGFWTHLANHWDALVRAGTLSGPLAPSGAATAASSTSRR